MIQISRTTLRALRRDIRQALDVTSAKHAPAVTLRSVKDQLVIQSATDQVAFEFRLPFASSTEHCRSRLKVRLQQRCSCHPVMRHFWSRFFVECRGPRIVVRQSPSN